MSDLETNPAIVYAKASSEYHIQYNQYTSALQQAMMAQQAGTPITAQQQQYLIVCNAFFSSDFLILFSLSLSDFSTAIASKTATVAGNAASS